MRVLHVLHTSLPNVSGYSLRHEPQIEGIGGLAYGRSSISDGVVVIELSDLALADMEEAVVTVFHEIYHVDHLRAFGNTGTEAEAEEYGRRMLARYLRRRGR